MALNGTTTVNKRGHSLLKVTWAVTENAAALDVSDEINFMGYSYAEWHIAAAPGYSSGDLKIGLCIEADGDGLIAEDDGRHLRALKSTTTLNESGYLVMPPPIARLTVGNHDGLSTGYTVILLAVPQRPKTMGWRRL